MSEYIFSLLLFCSTVFAQAENNIKGLQHNNDGVAAIEREDYGSAESHFLKGLAEDAFNPYLRINLGLAYELQKRFDRALKEYGSALRLKNLPDGLRFIAHFNSGNAAVQNNDVEGALKHFQAALAVDPDSIETKKNIELLMASGAGESKGGRGESGAKDKKENQDRQDQNNEQNPSEDQDKQEKKQKKEFKSESLTKEDVKKIMEEIKSQEKKIRALEYGDKTKEGRAGKDW